MKKGRPKTVRAGTKLVACFSKQSLRLRTEKVSRKIQNPIDREVSVRVPYRIHLVLNRPINQKVSACVLSTGVQILLYQLSDIGLVYSVSVNIDATHAPMMYAVTKYKALRRRLKLGGINHQ
jgi:hypothetical protein